MTVQIGFMWEIMAGLAKKISINYVYETKKAHNSKLRKSAKFDK